MATSKSIFFIRLIWALLVGAWALSPAFGQVLNVEKLKSTSILEIARTGASQDVIVEFESGGIELKNDSERTKVMREHDAARTQALQRRAPTQTIDEDAHRQDENLRQALHSQLDAIKQATFADHLSGNCTIVRDFSSMPTALVRVPDYASLLKLLANQNVKRVSADEMAHLSANWPSSYSDVSIVGSDVKKGVNGYKGTGTRVVVVDTGAYLAAIPGWDGSRNGCLPYRVASSEFVETNLAVGQTVNSVNCRIWSMYNLADADAPCAAPVYIDGSNSPCHGAEWQHATLVDEVVAKVAPSTYITNLQVYDSSGASRKSIALSAFDWVFDHRAESPRIVALNYSSTVGSTVYSASCPESDFASKVERLRGVGIITVAAAGNSASRIGIGEPACVPGVIAVGATTDSATPAVKYSAASNNCSDPALGVDQVPC
ncbi:MAG TPA: S8 family serine peptidase, partial [Burkholderiaceae bacterium]|nr:S8 family serine peptidase [Burkholderiaceae bacterium]